MGYCSVSEVVKPYPSFVRNAPGSVQDSDIEGWIEAWASKIHSAFLTRGVDLDTLTPTQRQSAFLGSINMDGAAADLGQALQGPITLQPGEFSIPAARRRSAERMLKEIAEGMHDALFGLGGGATATFGGVGGAERAKEDTPEALDENKSFGKNQKF